MERDIKRLHRLMANTPPEPGITGKESQVRPPRTRRVPQKHAGLYDPEEFPFLAEVARHWKEILAEVEALRGDGFILWPERNLYQGGINRGGDGWTVYGLYNFGNKIDENCARCPLTTRLIEAVPGMKMAGFSSLKASSHISEHKGQNLSLYEHRTTPFQRSLTLHLGPRLRWVLRGHLPCPYGAVRAPLLPPPGCRGDHSVAGRWVDYIRRHPDPRGLERP
jgi:hypothetical protein